MGLTLASEAISQQRRAAILYHELVEAGACAVPDVGWAVFEPDGRLWAEWINEQPDLEAVSIFCGGRKIHGRTARAPGERQRHRDLPSGGAVGRRLRPWRHPLVDPPERLPAGRSRPPPGGRQRDGIQPCAAPAAARFFNAWRGALSARVLPRELLGERPPLRVDPEYASRLNASAWQLPGIRR